MATYHDLLCSKQAVWNSVGITIALAVSVEASSVGHHVGLSHDTILTLAGAAFMGCGFLLFDVVAKLVTTYRSERTLAKFLQAEARVNLDLPARLQAAEETAARLKAEAPAALYDAPPDLNSILVSETLGTVTGTDLARCQAFAAYERFVVQTYDEAEPLRPVLTFFEWQNMNPFTRAIGAGFLKRK